jgi:hypothetical protein
LNSTDAGLGGINVYDDDHDDHDDNNVRGVDDSKSATATAVEVESISSQHGATTVLAIDAVNLTPNSETGSNDFKPPPANKPSFPPPPPAPRTVTSALFQSVVNPDDHDHNDPDDKDDDDDDVDESSQSPAPSPLQPSYPSKVPPPPPPPQLLLPPTTHQSSSSSSLVPPPPSSSQPSSSVPSSIPNRSSNIQDILNQKFSEKNIQKPIEQVQNPVASNITAVNKVIDDTKGGFNEAKLNST